MRKRVARKVTRSFTARRGTILRALRRLGWLGAKGVVGYYQLQCQYPGYNMVISL